MADTLPRLHLIQTRQQLSAALGVPDRYIEARAYIVDPNLLYTEFTIPKRSGGERTIHAPHWPTAVTQRRIKELLDEIYRPSPRVMGFVKGKGIRSNAQFHVGKRLLLNIDLADYFGTVHFGRVRGRLMAPPYNLTNDVATTIAKLCTLNGFLPTGAPTSPMLANMVTSSLDGALTEYSRQSGCFYTRYADDITFSTNRSAFPSAMVQRSSQSISGFELGSELRELIEVHGFEVQPSKTRLMNNSVRKEVCGVTCNERLNIRRNLYREVRGALHAWRKHGREAAEATWNRKFNWRNAQSLENHIRGRIQHIIHIRGQNDRTVNNLVSQFNSLPSRSFSDIQYSYESNDPLGIHETVCLIECADETNVNDLQYSQGSGFVIGSGSVMTNYHVISYARLTKKGRRKRRTNGELVPPVIFPEIKVSFEDAKLKFDMEVAYADPSRDIAILRPKETAWRDMLSRRACKLSFAALPAQSEVILAGFPNHAPGGSCKIVPGHVTGRTPIEGQTYITISQIVVQGNSGGPVFDKLGQVVGIATKGVSPSEQQDLSFNGCIPLSSLDRTLLRIA